MRSSPVSILRAARRSRGSFWFLVLQIALGSAVVIEMADLAVYFLRSGSAPIGIAESSIFLISTEPKGDPALVGASDRSALASLPGVRAASRVACPPLDWSIVPETLEALGQPETASVGWTLDGDAWFPEALGLTLRDGRFFTPNDRSDASEAPILITASLARSLFGNEHAAGRMVRSRSRRASLRVVGVVADVVAKGAYVTASKGTVIHLSPGQPWRTQEYVVRVDDGVASSFAPAARAALERIDPNRWIRVRTYAEFKSRITTNFSGGALIVSLNAFVLISVILLGSLGIASFLVAERTRHMGIRRALGGRRRDIVRYFLIENFITTNIGLILGIPLTYVLSLFLSKLDPSLSFRWSIVLLGVVLFWITGLLAAFVPARQGAQVPPTVASSRV